MSDEVLSADEPHSLHCSVAQRLRGSSGNFTTFFIQRPNSRSTPAEILLSLSSFLHVDVARVDVVILHPALAVVPHALEPPEVDPGALCCPVGRGPGVRLHLSRGRDLRVLRWRHHVGILRSVSVFLMGPVV